MNFKDEKGITLISLIVIACIIIIGASSIYFFNFFEKEKTNNTTIENNVTMESKEVNEVNDLIFSFETTKKKEIKIIDKNEKYNVVTFGGNVEITIGEKSYSLEDAFKKNLITVDDLLIQFNKDKEKQLCSADFYLDGGSQEYSYKTYTVIVTNRILEESHDIIFAPTNKEVPDIFNTYLRLKENNYTGSDYEDGIGISATVKQIVNDELWVVYYGNMEYLVQINDEVELDTDIVEGDKINLVYSGNSEMAYRYQKYFATEDEPLIIKIYNNETDAEENEADEQVKQLLSERCWIIGDDSNRMVLLEDDCQIEGDELNEGSFFKVDNCAYGSLSGISYLKDVTKIEKSE